MNVVALIVIAAYIAGLSYIMFVLNLTIWAKRANDIPLRRCRAMTSLLETTRRYRVRPLISARHQTPASQQPLLPSSTTMSSFFTKLAEKAQTAYNESPISGQVSQLSSKVAAHTGTTQGTTGESAAQQSGAGGAFGTKSPLVTNLTHQFRTLQMQYSGCVSQLHASRRDSDGSRDASDRLDPFRRLSRPRRVSPSILRRSLAMESP